MKTILLTKAEYARRRGVSAAAVSNAIAEGRITVTLDGDRQMIDPVAADAQWAANSRRRATGSAASSNEASPRRGGDVGLYEDPRRMREDAEAQIAVLRLGELRGDLIRVEAVRRALAAKISEMRDRFLGIPARVAPSLAGCHEVEECARLLEEEVRHALIAIGGDMLSTDVSHEPPISPTRT